MRKKDHAPGTTINNQPSLQRLKEVLSEGNCICIFPEGISRYHPSLAALQAGIAHLSFEVASTSNCEVYLQPCGLTYLHRSKFRSSVLVEFAPPVKVTPEMTEKTEILSLMEIALRRVTLNAPDWPTIK